MAKYFPYILHRHLNTREYAERNLIDEVKGTVFPENRMWDYKLAFDEQVTNLYFEQRKKHKKFGTKNCSFDGF